MEETRNSKHWLVSPPPPGILISVFDTRDNRGWRVMYPEEISARLPEYLYWRVPGVGEEMDHPAVPNAAAYYILKVKDYGDVVFYGTEKEADDLKMTWEFRSKSSVFLKKATKSDPKHKKLVSDEIEAIRLDRSFGIQIPPVQTDGWF